MSRITIQDIPQDRKISKSDMRKVMGGVEPTTFPTNRIFNLWSNTQFGNVLGSQPIQFSSVNLFNVWSSFSK